MSDIKNSVCYIIVSGMTTSLHVLAILVIALGNVGMGEQTTMSRLLQARIAKTRAM